MGPFFYYKAKDLHGKAIKGIMEAEDRQTALGLLRSRDLFTVKLSPVQTGKINVRMPHRKVRLKELAVFCRQLSIMNAAGVHLLQTLRDLGEQITDPLLKKIIGEATVSLEKGKSLSEAFEINKESLPPIMTNMLMAAESSGSLDLVLQRLADSFERELQVRGKIQSAMAYPLFVIVVTILAVVVLLIFVVPIFADVFAQMGAELPGTTRILLGVSEQVQRYFILAVPLLIIFFLSVNYLAKVKIINLAKEKLLLRLPVVGPIIKGVLTSRFAYTLSMLLKSGIPLLVSLETMEKVMGNSIVSQEISEVRNRVAIGERIAPVLLDSKVFPKMVVRMIAVGEDAGVLVDVLDKLGSYYDQEVDFAITRLTGMLEPMLIALVGLMVGFIALSIYLPLFGLTGVM